MGDVVQFPGVTRLDLDPDAVLDRVKGKLTGCVILGYDEYGNEQFFSTYASAAETNWLLDRCKLALLDCADDQPD